MALTRITKGVIKPNENYDTHNINSTGIITATKFVGPLDAGVSGTNANFTGIVTAGNFKGGAISGTTGTFTGNVSIGGTLTYEDVTNIDSVGIITARDGIRVTSGDILLTGGDGRKISFASDGSSHYFKMDNSFNGPVINGYGGIKFETNGTNERLRITSAGKVGIGTDLPLGTLDIYNANADASNTNSLGAQINAAWIRIGDVASVNKTFSNGLGTKLFDQGTAHWSYGMLGQDFLIANTSGDGNKLFPSNRTAPFIIKSGGQVGVGTENPLSGLHISDGTAYGSPQNSSKKATLIISAGSEGSSDIQLLSANYNHIFFGDSADANTGIIWYEHTGTATDSMHFSTAGTERLRINSNGKVAIGGYGNPNSILDVREEKDGAETQIRLYNTDNGDTTTQTAAFYMSPDSRGAAYTGLRAIKENASFATNAGRDISLTLTTTQNNAQVEAVRIKSDGKVGVNTTTPAQQFTSYAASGYPILANGNDFGIGIGGNGAIVFGTRDLGSYAKGILDFTELEFKLSGSPIINIDTSGRLLIGHTASIERHEAGNSSLQVSGTGRDDTNIAIGRWSADANPARLEFSKSRNATIGNNTAVQANDELGHINFSGNDGSRYLGAAYIKGIAASPIADYDCAGYLSFGTNYGTTSPSERVRIEETGNVLFHNFTDNIGSNSSGEGFEFRRGEALRISRHDGLGLIVNRTGDDGDLITLRRNGSGKADLGIRGNDLTFDVAGSERLRIDAVGYVGINTTTPQRYIHIVGNDGPSGATSGNSDSTMLLDNAGTNGAMLEFLNANNGAGHIMFTDTDGANTGRISYHHNGDYFRLDAGGLASRVLLYGTGATIFKSNSASHIILDRAADNAYIRFRSNSVDDAATIQCSESSGGAFLTLKTKNVDGNLRNRFDITNNGNTYTAEYGGNNRTYPIIGGAAIGSSGAEAGQVNWHDIQSPLGTVGGWVYLGLDYNGAHPWPAKAYKIAKHENGINCTRVYQIWHDGDANYDYGGLYEVRLNEWGSSSGHFESATFRCVNGKRDDMKLLCYNDDNGVWIMPNTIWGQIFIRRSGWDNSGRIRGSSYCAVANNGALAVGDTAGVSGTIPSGSGKFELYPFDGAGGSHTGGRDMENENNFAG